MSQHITNTTQQLNNSPSQLPFHTQDTAQPHPPHENETCLASPVVTLPLTSCDSLPCPHNFHVPSQQPCQFTPLDQLNTSKKCLSLTDEQGEGALKIGMGQDQDKNHEDFLQCIKATSLPTKVIVHVVGLTKDYDQAYRTLLPSELHKVKCIYFANLLIAAFEIKELSEDEVKESRQMEVFKMEEKELVSMVTKTTEGFFKHLNQHSQGNEQRWAKIAECFKEEAAPFTRKAILLTPDYQFESICLTITPQVQLPTPSNTYEEVKKNECDENNADCNNLSTQTQGHVTDLEISLSACHNENVEDITFPQESEKTEQQVDETAKQVDEGETVAAFESA